MFQTCWFFVLHALIFHMQTALGETLMYSLKEELCLVFLLWWCFLMQQLGTQKDI